jgi:hypothetical protein
MSTDKGALKSLIVVVGAEGKLQKPSSVKLFLFFSVPSQGAGRQTRDMTASAHAK